MNRIFGRTCGLALALALAGCGGSVKELGPTQAKPDPEAQKKIDEQMMNDMKNVQEKTGQPMPQMPNLPQVPGAGSPGGEKK